jgi:hypothetical protein
MRSELKQPKNFIGVAFLFIAILLTFIAYESYLSAAVYHIAIGFFTVGFVLVVIPGRAADPGTDHQEGGKDE